MGQTIEVKTVLLGDVAVFDTDRSVTGQDGQGFGSIAAARDGATTADRLATKLFASEAAIDHVFVLSNQVTVRRTGGWSEESAGKAAQVIGDFFIFYEDNRGFPTQKPED
ncbi:MAG: hypothetical protein OEM81_08910 [Acidimicrobiia bacterium]|nr:hypothetical protein [Acidimicrobiia bacterium]MDH3397934.1 hypothetical protein [Acidimicrobiia bacterium]MDH5615949.1 hypothetical protein [Acidimicrobiia bacterium]